MLVQRICASQGAVLLLTLGPLLMLQCLLSPWPLSRRCLYPSFQCWLRLWPPAGGCTCSTSGLWQREWRTRACASSSALSWTLPYVGQGPMLGLHPGAAFKGPRRHMAARGCVVPPSSLALLPWGAPGQTLAVHLALHSPFLTPWALEHPWPPSRAKATTLLLSPSTVQAHGPKGLRTSCAHGLVMMSRARRCAWCRRGPGEDARYPPCTLAQ